jgi:hypothetical protein
LVLKKKASGHGVSKLFFTPENTKIFSHEGTKNTKPHEVARAEWGSLRDNGKIKA